MVQRMYQRLALFWYSLIILLRFLKGFRGQPRVAMIAETLKFASIDLAHFLIIFCAVFISFALGGFILFGPHLEEWSSFVLAVTTAFRLLLGSAADYYKLHQVSPIVAAWWYWTYILLVVFVMLNLLVALIIDEDGQSIVQQLHEAYLDFKWSMGYEGTARNPTLDEILDLFVENPDDVRELSLFEMKLKSREVSGRAAEPVTVQTLVDIGLQKSYAKRLLNDCRSKMLTRDNTPTDPVDMIAREMEESFSGLYLQLSQMGPRLTEGIGNVQEVLQELEDVQKAITPVVAQIRQMTVLPSDWSLKVEESTGKEYFLHNVSGVASWDVPKEFAAAAVFQRFLMKRANIKKVQDKMAAAMKEGMKQKFVNTFVNKLKYKTFGKGEAPDAVTPGGMFDLAALKEQAAEEEAEEEEAERAAAEAAAADGAEAEEKAAETDAAEKKDDE